MFCQSLGKLHDRGMKVALWISAACALPFLLTGCGNSGSSSAGGSQQPGIGPFDSQGRYREEWADNPSQWRRPGSSPARVTKTEELPQIAQNEQPPLNSVPLVTSNSYTPRPTISETRTTTRTTVTTNKQPGAVVVKTRPLSQAEQQAVANKTKSRSEEVVKKKPKAERDVVKAKTKPKPIVKAKPKVTRYVVKSGDSLSAIASRNGCSVSALKSENGISGTLIRPGQSLKIPKR